MQEAAMPSRHQVRTHRGVVHLRAGDLAVAKTKPPRRRVPVVGRAIDGQRSTSPAARPPGLAWRFHEINQSGRIEITPTDLILRSRAKRGVSKDERRRDLGWGRPSRRARERAPQDEADGLCRYESNLGNAVLAWISTEANRPNAER
jgi:hypothetical protein